MIYTFEEIKQRIHPILEEYAVRSAYLFGSYARNEATEASDVDLRIDRGNSPKLKGMFGVSGLLLDLEKALGKPVDLLTTLPKHSKLFRENLHREERRIYG